MRLKEVVVPACTSIFSGLVALKVEEPMPRLPVVLRRIFSVLLVMNGRSKASMVPSFFSVVTVLPPSPQKLLADAKVDMGSFLTSPLVMVSRLSAVVLVPACTPVRVRGFVAITLRAEEKVLLPAMV